MHVLAEAERSGSSCTPLPVLLAEARALLGEEPPVELLEDLACLRGIEHLAGRAHRARA